MSRKTVVYDGDCPMCVATSRWMVEYGWIDEAHRRAFQTFEGDAAARLLEAGIRDGVVVVDDVTGELRIGYDGLAFVAEGKPAPVVVRTAFSPGLAPLARTVYALVAANRRAVAPPPPRDVACACDPSPKPLIETAFFALCFLLFAGVVALEAHVVAGLTVERRIGAGWIVQAAEIAPWVLQALVAASLVGRKLPYLAGFSWSAAVSALAMLPFLGVALFLGAGAAFVALAVGVAVRLALLRRMESKRRPASARGNPFAAWWIETALAGLVVLATAGFLALR